MQHFYHGSTTQDLKILEPRKRYTPRGMELIAIYATPLPAYAAAHAFPWGSEEGFDVTVIDGKVELTVPKSYEYRLNVPISIYTLPSQGFVHTKEESTGYTWHSVEPAAVLEEKAYASAKEALMKLGGTITYID